LEKALRLLGVLGFHRDGALGAHQRFPGLLPRESMLSIAFRTLKNVGTLFSAKTALSAYFRGMGFVSHVKSSFSRSDVSRYFFENIFDQLFFSMQISFPSVSFCLDDFLSQVRKIDFQGMF
jgi:hypothetical protein